MLCFYKKIFLCFKRRNLRWTKTFFSDIFNRLLVERGVKLKELSEKLDIRPEKLSKLKNAEDTVNPSVDDLIKISDFFNVSIDELLGRHKEENPQSIMLDFVTSILKLHEKSYFNIFINSVGTAALSPESQDFLSSNEYLATFQERNYTPKFTRGYTIETSSACRSYETMYYDIIDVTLFEWENLKSISPHIQDLWLKDRIKRLDAVYHFSEKTSKNETKDSE